MAFLGVCSSQCMAPNVNQDDKEPEVLKFKTPRDAELFKKCYAKVLRSQLLNNNTQKAGKKTKK